MTNIFLSWGGEQSKEIAEELRTWIPSVLQFAKPYFTPSDVEKGSKWSSEISKKLSESHVGIICLTKENFERPWILFEAGALSKDLEKSKVCSVLFGMENTDLTGPLTTFQTTNFTKSDFKKLMNTINETGADQKLSRDTFDRVFEMWWPQLDEGIGRILEQDHQVPDKAFRSDRDILEEILTLSRAKSSSHVRPSVKSSVPIALTEDLVNYLKDIATLNQEKFFSAPLNDKLHSLVRISEYLFRHSDDFDDELGKSIASLNKECQDFIPF